MKIDWSGDMADGRSTARGGLVELVVTDLTRFVNQKLVCMAGIDRETGDCIRPLPYLRYDVCRRVGIVPGSVLRGEFVRASVTPPHSEDRHWLGRRSYRGQCRGREFLSMLRATESPSLEQGFGVSLASGKKYFPLAKPPARSIITLSIHPSRFQIAPDATRPGRISAIFHDRTGRRFQFVSITDLGFQDHARRRPRPADIAKLNNFIHAQRSVFLRVGLSREHHAPDGRAGYWLQVNGIYTFPKYIKEIRTYPKDGRP